MSAHPDIPELAGTVPVVLYFGSQADADEFIAIVRQAKPGLVARSLSGDPIPTREPEGFCVWCNRPYFEGDPTYVNPASREVHCTRACSDEHDANL